MQSGERVGIDHLLCVTLLNEIGQSPTGPELRWEENSEVRIQEVRMQSGERVGSRSSALRYSTQRHSVTPKRVQLLLTLTLTTNSPEGLKLIASGALFPEREQMSYSIEKQIEEWLAQRGSED